MNIHSYTNQERNYFPFVYGFLELLSFFRLLALRLRSGDNEECCSVCQTGDRRVYFEHSRAHALIRRHKVGCNNETQSGEIWFQHSSTRVPSAACVKFTLIFSHMKDSCTWTEACCVPSHWRMIVIGSSPLTTYFLENLSESQSTPLICKCFLVIRGKKKNRLWGMNCWMFEMCSDRPGNVTPPAVIRGPLTAKSVSLTCIRKCKLLMQVAVFPSASRVDDSHLT